MPDAIAQRILSESIPALTYNQAMLNDFGAAFLALKTVFDPLLEELIITVDNDHEYTLVTRKPSPLPQYKGAPMFFGSVRKGKAYASLHLFPLYVSPELLESMPPELSRRMQGKSCLNFKIAPAEQQHAALCALAAEGLRNFRAKGLA